MKKNLNNIFNQGILDFKQNNYFGAIKKFKSAYNGYILENNFIKAGQSLNKIGEAFLLSQQFRKSLNYLLKAYILRKENEVDNGILESLNSLGEIYYYIDNFEKSKFYYENCINEAKK